jgi:hypothetical protein
LRNNEPLVIEKRFGNGRVVAQLSKLSSGDTALGRWTNWSLNPAFPILANELVSYLAAGRLKDPNFAVGDDLVASGEEGKYEPTFRFFLPAAQASGDVGPSRAEVPVDATSADGILSARLEDVAASGIYEVQLQPMQGNLEERPFGVNIAPGEGDLAITHGEELSRQLAGVDFQLHDAADMTLDDQKLAGFQMSDALLVAIVVILLGEQMLAYMASFHAAPTGGPRR